MHLSCKIKLDEFSDCEALARFFTIVSFCFYSLVMSHYQ